MNQETLNRIKADAFAYAMKGVYPQQYHERLYSHTGGIGHYTDYIAAATAEAARSEILVTALEKVFEKDGYEFVREALSQYNHPF